MDAEKIGKVILELRKHHKLTQLQLAEKLYVSDKAISKWELGASIPDIQQLESITRMFNISYDLLLSGDVEKVKLYLLQQEPAPQKLTTREKFNPTEWYSLDNAAKVYPPQASNDWNMVFRMAAVMKEPIDKDILNQALLDMVDRLPTFMVTIKKGFFWYYFERVEKNPKVQEGGKYPCRSISLDGKNYLFRVLVENNRIACDFFHSLTDGTGGTIFLTTLITRYYELKYGSIKDYKCALNVLDKVREEEIQDSFAHYATKGGYIKREIKHAYHMKEKYTKESIITHVVMDANELKALAKKYGCTVTVFLTAVYSMAFLRRRAFDRDTRPYIIQIPINLRKRFPSETLRNFAYFTGIEISDMELSLEETIKTVKEQLEKGTDMDFLQKSINANMRDEKNIFIRVAPIFLKDPVLKIVSGTLGEEGFTTVFSNVGNLNAPDELKRIVDRFEFVLKDDRSGGISMSGITFNNKCVISFIRSVERSSIERDFVRELTALGLNIYVEGNGGVQ